MSTGVSVEVKMNKFEFTIIASGLDPQSQDFEDRFFEAGCSDATIAFVKGRILVEFEREARNFTHALVSAIVDVQKTGAIVEHIEPDYLVNLSDIAERSNLSKAAVSLFAKGERGQGFPSPVSRVTSESPLWDWFYVARWLYQRGQISLAGVVRAKMVRQVNRAVSDSRGKLEHSSYGRKILQEIAA
jgi:hypothetical protein